MSFVSFKLKLIRFSLSWSRLLPTADASKPNQLGVDYYKSYISEILKYNMTPVERVAVHQTRSMEFVQLVDQHAETILLVTGYFVSL